MVHTVVVVAVFVELLARLAVVMVSAALVTPVLKSPAQSPIRNTNHTSRTSGSRAAVRKKVTLATFVWSGSLPSCEPCARVGLAGVSHRSGLDLSVAATQGNFTYNAGGYAHKHTFNREENQSDKVQASKNSASKDAWAPVRVVAQYEEAETGRS